MPNILLTQKCVRRCPYCFAERHISTSPPDDILSWENLIYLADFLEAGGERRFSLLGGEPTLHPFFTEIVLYLIQRSFDVVVFTSGIIKTETVQIMDSAFKEIPEERITFICNINDPLQTPMKEQHAILLDNFLQRFGPRTILGFNIYRLDFDLTFLVDTINRYGLKRTIRLGIAHPICGAENQFIRIHDIEKVIERIFEYKELLERFRVRPGLDCGFPMCKFSDDQLGWLLKNNGGHCDFGCGPVVDIGPDMTVWSCFPLSSHRKKSIFDFNSLKDVFDYFQKIHNAVRTEQAGIYENCDSCPMREENRCAGGCIAHAVRAFKNEPRLRFEEVYE